MIQPPMHTVRRGLQVRWPISSRLGPARAQVQMIGLNLTPVEVAVFGSNPAPDTIEAFRYRYERVQRLIPQPKRRRRQPRLSIPGGLLTTAQAAAKLGSSSSLKLTGNTSATG